MSWLGNFKNAKFISWQTIKEHTTNYTHTHPNAFLDDSKKNTIINKLYELRLIQTLRVHFFPLLVCDSDNTQNKMKTKCGKKEHKKMPFKLKCRLGKDEIKRKPKKNDEEYKKNVKRKKNNCISPQREQTTQLGWKKTHHAVNFGE